jgi:hypothetical protein
MDYRGRTVTAPFVFFHGQFRRNIRISVNHQGLITAIGPTDVRKGSADSDDGSMVNLSNMVHINIFL